MGDRELERRLRDLEGRVADLEARVPQDLAMTVPWGSQLSGTYMSALHTGADEFGVWLAPVDLRGRLDLARVRTIVDSDSPPNVAEFCLGIYRMTSGVLDRQDPVGEPLAVELLATLSRFEHDAGEDVIYAALIGQRRLVLDPRAGRYFVGFQGNQYARFHTPQGNMSRRTQPTAYQTIPVPTAVGELPERLEVVGSASMARPLFVLYSDLGLRLHGDRIED